MQAIDGEVLFTVAAEVPLDFGCGRLDPSPTADGPRLAALVKLDAEGRCHWSKTFRGDVSLFALGMDTRKNAIVAGTFRERLEFDWLSYPNHGNRDLFFAAFRP